MPEWPSDLVSQHPFPFPCLSPAPAPPLPSGCFLSPYTLVPQTLLSLKKIFLSFLSSPCFTILLFPISSLLFFPPFPPSPPSFLLPLLSLLPFLFSYGYLSSFPSLAIDTSSSSFLPLSSLSLFPFFPFPSFNASYYPSLPLPSHPLIPSFSPLPPVHPISSLLSFPSPRFLLPIPPLSVPPPSNTPTTHPQIHPLLA